MATEIEPEPSAAGRAVRGGAFLAELHRRVSYAGNVRPDPADTDEETPGDEADDVPGAGTGTAP